MHKQMINSENAPAPIGPYSQAIKAGGFLFLSGQIAINPKSGELVIGDFASQCRQVLDNLRAVLEAANIGLKEVVKVSIFMKDLGKFNEFNVIYGEYFDEFKPARACVEVSGLPKGVDIEVEAIALCQ